MNLSHRPFFIFIKTVNRNAELEGVSDKSKILGILIRKIWRSSDMQLRSICVLGLEHINM